MSFRLFQEDMLETGEIERCLEEFSHTFGIRVADRGWIEDEENPYFGSRAIEITNYKEGEDELDMLLQDMMGYTREDFEETEPNETVYTRFNIVLIVVNHGGHRFTVYIDFDSGDTGTEGFDDGDE